MTNTRSNTFNTLITRVTNTTSSTGASSGTVTRRNTCHSVAPSTRAASSASRGIAASPAAMNVIANPAMIHSQAEMIVGVISAGPSQVSPRNGSAKFAAGSRTVYEPAGRSATVNRPSSPVVAVVTTRPSCTTSTARPGTPRSPGRSRPAGRPSRRRPADEPAQPRTGGGALGRGRLSRQFGRVEPGVIPQSRSATGGIRWFRNRADPPRRKYHARAVAGR